MSYLNITTIIGLWIVIQVLLIKGHHYIFHLVLYVWCQFDFATLLLIDHLKNFYQKLIRRNPNYYPINFSPDFFSCISQFG